MLPRLYRVQRGRSERSSSGSRRGLRKPFRVIALLHRLGSEYHQPEVIGRKLDAEKQQAFIEAYGKLLNSLGPDEAVLFLDAVFQPCRTAG